MLANQLTGLFQDAEAFFNAAQNARVVVIYCPESERSSHQFEAVLAAQFDTMIWIEHPPPVTAMALPKSQELEPEDETFPFGV